MSFIFRHKGPVDLVARAVEQHTSTFGISEQPAEAETFMAEIHNANHDAAKSAVLDMIDELEMSGATHVDVQAAGYTGVDLSDPENPRASTLSFTVTVSAMAYGE